MKIGYDAKRFFHNHTGLGNYSRTLIQDFLEFYPENEVTLFGSNTDKSPYKKDVHCSIIDPGKQLKSYWRSYSIYKDINREKLQIYHGLSNELPLTSHRINAYKVVTIHDLFFEKYPDDFTCLDRKMYGYKTRKACQNADHIIAISEATKNDIVEILGVNPAKISVIYQSCNRVFQTNTLHKTSKKYQLKLDELPEDFALFVGTLNKRKNIMGLLKAISILPKKDRIPLVIVGNGKADFVSKLKEFITKNNMQKEVFWMGSLQNFELKQLYQRAKFCCLPSFYEGFGIPIIESLFCGTPVLYSNVSALPEAAGACGMSCNPYDFHTISHSFNILATNKVLIADYQSNIEDHVNSFKSKRTSNSLLKLYESIFFHH